MGEVTGIGWTDSTWNFVTGCTRVSAGCDHCYAYAFHDRQHESWAAGRNPSAPPQYHKPFSEVQVIPERLTLPLKWRKPRRVFVNSMSDFFHKDIPDEVLIAAFAVMALCPEHQFQILTKRPQRMKRVLTNPKLPVFVGDAVSSLESDHPDRVAEFDRSVRWPLPNVWLGVSVESQEVMWRTDELITTPAAVRFISVEPLLGPLDLVSMFNHPIAAGWMTPVLDWVIVGGESGAGYREMSLDWVERIATDCRDYQVALFVKQDSGFRSGQQGRIPDALWAIKQFPDSGIQKMELPF